MLANSWAVFGYVGKQLQLGSHLNLEILYTEQRTMPSNVQHGEEQNDFDFPVFLFFENLHLFPVLQISVESQSDSHEHFQQLQLQDARKTHKARPFMAVLQI